MSGDASTSTAPAGPDRPDPRRGKALQNLFADDEPGRAFGLFGATVGISTAVGPVVGGAILAVFGEADGWRWTFFVNLPIGIVALVLAARLIPPVPGSGEGHRGIDWVGVGLLGGAVLAVLLPLVQAESGGVGRWWWLFAVGVVLGALFVLWERRVLRRDDEPLLDLRLLFAAILAATLVLLAVVLVIAVADLRAGRGRSGPGGEHYHHLHYD